MPLTDEEKRELVAWFMDVRMRGVHPDWIVIWCGANTGRMREMLQWVKTLGCPWPNATHMTPPDYTNAFNYLVYYKNGLPVWEQIQKDITKD